MPKTILIVDDDPNIREYLETLLTDNGYETIVAENGDVDLREKKDKNRKRDLDTDTESDE